MKHTFTLTSKIENLSYSALIKLLSGHCKFFHLVVREGLGLDSFGEKVLNNLSPYLVEKKTTKEWPGTSLCGDQTATLYIFSLTTNSSKILTDSSKNLFEWCQPRLPEDLSFYNGDLDPFFVTIAHEKDAYFSISKKEHHALIKEAPHLLLRKD